MRNSNAPPWLKYLIAIIVVALLGAISEIPDLTLPSPQDSGWSPPLALVHAVVVGAAFSLIVLIASIWSNRSQSQQSNFRRGLLVFILFGSGDFVVELLARPFFFGLSRRPELEAGFVRLVHAGRGWLLPLVFLTIFVAFILLRSNRSG